MTRRSVIRLTRLSVATLALACLALSCKKSSPGQTEACLDDTDCPDKYRCEIATGTCVLKPPPPLDVIYDTPKDSKTDTPPKDNQSEEGPFEDEYDSADPEPVPEPVPDAPDLPPDLGPEVVLPQGVCAPCAVEDECKGTGGTPLKCVDVEQTGKFCLPLCGGAGQCPAGMECEAFSPGPGMPRRCFPEGGKCPCTDKAGDLGLEGLEGCKPYSADGDKDGHGGMTDVKCLCAPYGAWKEQGADDCDDSDPDVHPGKTEACDGKDNDCNGATDEGEVCPCDDGVSCTDSKYEEGKCTHTLMPGFCFIDNQCFVGAAPKPGDPCQYCDPAKNQGAWTARGEGEACDADGTGCTIGDSCTGGKCQKGPPANCADLTDLCNVGTCKTVGTDKYVCEKKAANEGGPCDDGNGCTVEDKCKAGACTGALPPGCDDGNPCTSDVCDPVQGCVHKDNAVPCDDGNACTKGDMCSAGACASGPQANCDDGNACTSDSCDMVKGCVHEPNSSKCDDGNVCTEGDHCEGGQCKWASVKSCEDDNSCTFDSCDPLLGCLYPEVPDGTLCDDGSGCTSNDKCTGGKCQGVGLVCDDGNSCTENVCTPGAGCSYPWSSKPCDDGDPCTVGDKCVSGKCTGSKADCDDGNPCTLDSCVSAKGGCQHTPATSACDDGNFCTQVDTCSNGKCVGGQTLACDDGNPCTSDLCDPAKGCTHAYNSNACDDGNKCTVGDVCKFGQCVSGQVAKCDDGNPCTDDSCDKVKGCLHVANFAACDDGNKCTVKDQCSGGKCLGGPAPDCGDGNACTDDTCDLAVGCVHKNNNDPCDDGNVCTENDVCKYGACAGGTAIKCPDDGNPCTDEYCKAGTGCVTVNNTKPCDDGVACTKTDTCKDGACGGTPYSCAQPNPDCKGDGTCGCGTASCKSILADQCAGGKCLCGGQAQCQTGYKCCPGPTCVPQNQNCP